jgi:hypothetical protein
MEEEDIYNAVRSAMDDARRDEPKSTGVRGMMAIEAFNAETGDGDPVRVVGVITSDDCETLDFIVIKTIDDGEMIPTVEGSVYALKK